MHEVSIAEAIARTVVEAVDGQSVESVEVEVGALSGVVGSALEFAWDVVTTDTPLAGSVLVVVCVATTVHCVTCDEVVTPDLGLLCPSCGELCADVRSGRELEITSARLRETAASEA